jgi:hypothetical protein
VIIRCGRRWLSTSMVALTVLALVGVVVAFGQQGASPPPDEPILWGRNVAGDSRAIQINADDAVTWADQGKRIILLKGKVWIEQGDAHLRAPEAVVWIDEANQKQNQIYHLEAFSDGGSSLEVQAQSYQAPVAMIELNTRGLVNLKTFKNKVVQQPAPDDPLYKRAAAAIAAQRTKPKPKQPSASLKSSVQQVANYESAPTAQPQSSLALDTLLPTAQPPGQPPLSGVPSGLQPAPVVIAPGQPGLPDITQPPPLLPLETPPSRVSIRPRSSEPFRSKEFRMPNGEKAVVISPGVIITLTTPIAPQVATAPKGPDGKTGPPATSPNAPFDKNANPFGPTPTPPKNVQPIVIPTVKTVEIAADRVVVWTQGDVKEIIEGTASTPTLPGQPARTYEFYLSGNVEIRDELIKKVGIGLPVAESRLLRAKEAYALYRAPSPEEPAGRNVAIVLDADLAERQPGLPDPIHVSSPEMHQLTDKFFTFDSSQFNASKLPYGPGLYLTTGSGTLEEKRIVKESVLGIQFYQRDTGDVEYRDELLFRAKNVFVWLEDVPVFWLPYVQGDARDPLGPLESINFGYNRAFGFNLMTTWDVFNLLGIDPIPGSHWRVDFDYYTARGFSTSTEYAAIGKNLAGISGNYNILIKAMGIDDHGTDIIGGDRGQTVTFGYPPPPTVLPIEHPDLRGRFWASLNWQELPYNLTVQTQIAGISDKNFLDQWYNLEWTNGPNQETYAYVKQQENDWALTFLVEPRIRNWITETEWLPEVGGTLIGQDLLDTFTYTNRTSLGFAHLLTTHQQPGPFEPTDVSTPTGRFDSWNELSLPLQLGAFKVVPYGVIDGTYYTQDLNGNDDFRLYGAGGVRASIPFSRLFPDVQSDLLNLDGIYHKIVMTGNFYWAHSDRSHLDFPQLDRLNDDQSDQTLRDIRPQQPALNPSNATFLNSGFFDPQLFALRKLVDNYIDTLDSIEEVNLDLMQRWQTKRGMPGAEHIIDWMTLDLSVAFFPQPNRDNFGQVVNFLAYDWSWAVGDRLSLFSSGWFDPHPEAARVWSFGADYNRPDNSSLYIGYRQIDPLLSRQVIASINVPFSAKYSLTASTSYDFGTNTQVNAVTITRKGTDVMVSLGLTYNTILNTVGFEFEVLPNLLPGTKQIPGLGNSMMGAR